MSEIVRDDSGQQHGRAAEGDPAAGSAPPAPLLEARDVVVRFGGLVAVDTVSLKVPTRSVVGLVGPNGAGKSTLFAVLSGLQRPQSGQVRLGGVDVTGATAQARARRGLARTFQHPEIFFTLTVREHLLVAYRARHARRRLVTDLLMTPSRWRRDVGEEDRVDSLLDQLELRGVEDRRAAALPLGMLRRLEVARALAAEPTLLLLDEPSSGLDVGETERLGEVLRAAVDSEGLSLLMVEHDLGLVLGLSDHVYVLDFGKLVADGTPAEIRASSVVRDAYLGTAGDLDQSQGAS
ncbi:ABC transporter ATP-binding protein [Parafrankia elaeagni]|uniref:ABC transporter ATP-binding protein n=1 Tax=Parafrankia elaeagni TaxID=222534 RepID=UPI000365F330|nr:ABC transporter ATP-binding protein [Parafrankia elaeagni]